MALEKQLLFYMIVGLVQPNSGNIYLDDLNITDYPMYGPAGNRIFGTRSFCF
jgi:lipopolysaccharide export system ATP-binding protein